MPILTYECRKCDRGCVNVITADTENEPCPITKCDRAGDGLADFRAEGDIGTTLYRLRIIQGDGDQSG